MKPATYVHIHIPKNAGQTFQAILSDIFGAGLVHAPETRPGHIYTDSEKRAFLAQHPQARCISGHAFRYPAPRRAGVSFRYVTFLRHPVDRLVSLYAYEKQLTAGSQHASQGRLDAWIDSRLAEDNALTNFQAFHIMGTADPAEVSLNTACKALDDYFFVGITERFDDSLRLLAHLAGFTLGDLNYQMRNVTGSRQSYPLAEATQQRLVELNSIDMTLYQAACQRFETAASTAANGVSAYALKRAGSWLASVMRSRKP